MAPDEPSQPRPRRSTALGAPFVDDGAGPPSLAELIGAERVELMQIHAMIRCLNDVLLYSDDDNSTMHADVAKVAARLLDESITRMEALRARAAEVAYESNTAIPPPHQVKEARPSYLC